VDTGGKIFVGLKRGGEIGKASAEQQRQTRICEHGLPQVFTAVESQSFAFTPYYSQPRSQRTESNNLSYWIRALHSALDLIHLTSVKLMFNGIARTYALESWNQVSRSVPELPAG
jgi:hypothetical protein